MLDAKSEWVLDNKKSSSADVHRSESLIGEIHPPTGANYDLATQGLVNYDEIKGATQLVCGANLNFDFEEPGVATPISNPVDNFFTNAVHDYSNAFGKENSFAVSALIAPGFSSIIGVGAQNQALDMNNDLINLLTPPVFCESLQNNFSPIIPINDISATLNNFIDSATPLWLKSDTEDTCLLALDYSRKLREKYSPVLLVIALIIVAYLVLESFSLFCPKFGGNRDLPIINH